MSSHLTADVGQPVRERGRDQPGCQHRELGGRRAKRRYLGRHQHWKLLALHRRDDPASRAVALLLLLGESSQGSRVNSEVMEWKRMNDGCRMDE